MVCTTSTIMVQPFPQRQTDSNKVCAWAGWHNNDNNHNNNHNRYPFIGLLSVSVSLIVYSHKKIPKMLPLSEEEECGFIPLLQPNSSIAYLNTTAAVQSETARLFECHPGEVAAGFLV